MTNTQTILVIESWDINAFGVIAELKHNLDGLTSGTIVKSISTGLEWQVKNRVLFYHALNKQKTFPNELTTYIHASFASIEKQVASAQNIIDKEEKDIFQYHLQPMEHSLKLKIGEMLIPVGPASL
jgi:hypothetical protein